MPYRSPRFLPALLGLLLLAVPSSATWSIVCVDMRTREVGVASATCLTNFDLREGVPVIRVGQGAAAAQSVLDVFGNNKLLIFTSLRDELLTPAEILAALDAQDGQHQQRQYGIVNFVGDPATFTGRRDGDAATGVAGTIGDLRYAIQGNVLTGDEVVFAAEAAFRATKGDMGQRMLAAMQAARALGGDGRCSCNANAPTSCGVPPPNFRKSAHVGVMIVARVGDTNGGCTANRGCATGDYYLNLNVRGGVAAPDPVETLGKRYDTWRRHLAGRPDAITSRVLSNKALPADGMTERTIVLELRDVEDVPLTRGGTLVEVVPLDAGGEVQLGPVTDLGNGRYAFTVRSGAQAGVERFSVEVTDPSPSDPSDVVTATLYPPLEVHTVDLALFAEEDTLSSHAGGRFAFVVNRPDRAQEPFLLAARLDPAGAPVPGLPASGWLPIPVSPFFPARPSRLDARGHAAAGLDVPPDALRAFVGARIEVRAFLLGGGTVEATPPATVDVLP